MVGVDVGSQGTCAQALEADGTLLASTYAPHQLSYPQPGWAQQDPGEWTRALVQTLAEVRLTVAGRPIAALSFGSQLDGLVATGRDGRALYPALVWSDRRAVAECEQVAERSDVAQLRAQTGCNMDAGHVAAKIAWLRTHEPDIDRAAASYLLPGSWMAWQASGECAVDPSNASSTGLLDPGGCSGVRKPARPTRSIRNAWRAIRPSDTVLGPIVPWLRDAAGLSADVQVVLGAGDEMAAVLGAGVVEPGEVCDVMGTAEPVCAVVGEPTLDASEVVELHPHAAPGRWLLENPGWLSGGAYRWFRDELGGPEVARAAATGADVYELLNSLARGAPPGADGVSWIPALSGAMAPEWNANARAGWFGLTAAHGRRTRPGAAGGHALALRDVVEAIAATGQRLTGLVCVGGARGANCCSRPGPCHRPDGVPVNDAETSMRGAVMQTAAGAGIDDTVVIRRRGDGRVG